MKYIILCIYFLLFLTNIKAQQKVENTILITGKVIDKMTNKPLEYASVYVEQINGKSKLGTTTNKRGAFNLSIPKGLYKLTVSFLSFESYIINNKNFSKNSNLGTIALKYESNVLTESFIKLH